MKCLCTKEFSKYPFLYVWYKYLIWSRMLTIISFWTQKSGSCRLITHASTYFIALQPICLSITFKAISGSTKCSVSNKCFVMGLLGALSSDRTEHFGKCSSMCVDKHRSCTTYVFAPTNQSEFVDGCVENWCFVFYWRSEYPLGFVQNWSSAHTILDLPLLLFVPKINYFPTANHAKQRTGLSSTPISEKNPFFL